MINQRLLSGFLHGDHWPVDSRWIHSCKMLGEEQRKRWHIWNLTGLFYSPTVCSVRCNVKWTVKLKSITVRLRRPKAVIRRSRFYAKMERLKCSWKRLDYFEEWDRGRWTLLGFSQGHSHSNSLAFNNQYREYLEAHQRRDQFRYSSNLYCEKGRKESNQWEQNHRWERYIILLSWYTWRQWKHNGEKCFSSFINHQSHIFTDEEEKRW